MSGYADAPASAQRQGAMAASLRSIFKAPPSHPNLDGGAEFRDARGGASQPCQVKRPASSPVARLLGVARDTDSSDPERSARRVARRTAGGACAAQRSALTAEGRCFRKWPIGDK